ncbi:MAG: transketolase [Elusimicrobia bacterium]|nr:transketolase [Elusimicrobiota bacterium]
MAADRTGLRSPRVSDARLRRLADEARRLIIEVACRSRTAHVSSALSCVDLLVTLYFGNLRLPPRQWDRRDIFVLSKGHAALALYAILTLKRLMPRSKLLGYLQNDGTLPGHLDRTSNKGIEVSAGSLGHGFSVALGMAHGYRLRKDRRRVWSLIGDGESQEGAIWEGALFAARLGLDNFTAILDYNNLQGYGRPRQLCHYEPVLAKWRAFGWDACRIDGHDFRQIRKAFRRPPRGRPRVIVADTTKGKGVAFMENELKWHYHIVTEDLKREALSQIGGARRAP